MESFNRKVHWYIFLLHLFFKLSKCPNLSALPWRQALIGGDGRFLKNLESKLSWISCWGVRHCRRYWGGFICWRMLRNVCAFILEAGFRFLLNRLNLIVFHWGYYCLENALRRLEKLIKWSLASLRFSSSMIYFLKGYFWLIWLLFICLVLFHKSVYHLNVWLVKWAHSETWGENASLCISLEGRLWSCLDSRDNLSCLRSILEAGRCLVEEALRPDLVGLRLGPRPPRLVKLKLCHFWLV